MNEELILEIKGTKDNIHTVELLEYIDKKLERIQYKYYNAKPIILFGRKLKCSDKIREMQMNYRLSKLLHFILSDKDYCKYSWC